MATLPTDIPERPGQRCSEFENDNHASDVIDNWEAFHENFPVITNPANGRLSPVPVAPVHRVVISGGPCGGKLLHSSI
jgi:hypothetical protein